MLRSTETAVIANNASLSGAVRTPPNFALCAIIMPSAWTAASLSFQASNDGTTYYEMFNAAGTVYNVTAAASSYIALDPVDFAGAEYLKIRSGTSGSAVAQGGARTLILMFRKVG